LEKGVLHLGFETAVLSFGEAKESTSAAGPRPGQAKPPEKDKKESE
jgi:hypothetical protein